MPPEFLFMPKVGAALKIILRDIRPLSNEAIKLTGSLGRVLAEDIYASSDIPGFDNSAMDGYAVLAADTQGANRKGFKVQEVIDDVRAGFVSKKRLKHNQAIRIMTGAPIPSGADSVVMVEDTALVSSPQSTVHRRNYGLRATDYGLIRIFKEIKRGENIRRRGEDIKKGELVIEKGTLLNAGHIGLLASLGKAEIKAAKKPKVAILATGDEVVDIDKKLGPGKLRSSNTYTLYSQVINCGGIPRNLGIVRDKPKELEAKLKAGMDCDLLLSSGGVSVGEYDLVKLVLARIGVNIKFWKVAMRPGKPLVFGTVRGVPVFGLPGNPVSSMISFEVFVRPAILRMQGQKSDMRKEVSALLEEDIKKKKGLRYFLRARTRWKDGKFFTRTTGPQGSGILKSMALANSLIILPEEEEFARRGAEVSVKFLE